MNTDDHRGTNEQKSRGERWLSLFGGPLAAGVQLGLSVLLLPLSCAIEWRTIFHLVSLVAVIAALGAGLLAWQRLQEQRATQPARSTRRLSRGYTALAVNALALFIIGARWLAVLTVEGCTTLL